ncbi:MAG: hypothetical protein AAF628_33895 [Planctomycetota bacterium]
MMTRITLVLLALAATAPAQTKRRTLVVARFGSAEFRDIQSAIDDARPNDIVVVRGGRYEPFVVNKGIRLVGDPEVIIEPGLGPRMLITNVPAGQTLVVRELSPRLTFSVPDIAITDNPGHVHLERLNAPNGIGVFNSRMVSMFDVTAGGAPAVALTQSTASFTDCDLSAQGALFTTAAVEMTQSSATFTAGRIHGADDVLGLRGPEPGVRLHSGQLTIAGDAQTRIEAGLPAPFGVAHPPAPAIEIVDGRLLLDPAVTLQPGQGAAGTVTTGSGNVRRQQVPTLIGSIAGGNLTLRLHAPGSQSVATLIGWPFHPPIPLPWGEMWISMFHAVLDVGMVDASGTLTTTVGLRTFKPGTWTLMQGVVTMPSGQLLTSTPLLMTID